jgi:subtilisin family serine protease
VVVAVIDWGFLLAHEDLVDQFEKEHAYDVCVNPDEPSDLLPNSVSYHGAGTMGLVAAKKNVTGMQGIAYEAKIWPIQAYCATGGDLGCDLNWKDGNPWATAVAKAVADAILDGRPTVVLLEAETCCGGNYESSIAVSGAIRKAIGNHIPVVLPAGNDRSREAGCDEAGNPISDTGAIVVGATYYDDVNWLDPDSSFGTRVDVSAPGDQKHDLTLTVATDTQRCDVNASDLAAYHCAGFGGTSSAAAKVAGVVALMLSKKRMEAWEVRGILKDSGEIVSNDPMYPPSRQGGVFLNAAAALAAIDPSCAPPP